MVRMIKRKCCLCGKEYETYCPSCREAAYQPSWINSFHSENCSKIYEACAGYSGNALSKDEAKVLLKICDLSDRANYTPSTQKLLDKILASDKKIVKENSDSNKVLESKNNSFNKNAKVKRK